MLVSTSELRKSLDLSKPLFLDTETTALYKNCTLVQTMQEGWEHPLLVFVNPSFKDAQKLIDVYEAIKEAHIVCHNYSFDGEVFRHDLGLECNPFKNFDCTLLLAKLLLFDKLDTFSLDKCLEYTLGYDVYAKNGLDKKEMQKSFMQGKDVRLDKKALLYASLDVKYMPDFWKLLQSKMHEGIGYILNLDKLFIHYALQWSYRGLPFDTNLIEATRASVEKDLQEAKSRLPWDLNVNSPKQVKEYMQTKLKIYADSYNELALKTAYYDCESIESFAILNSRKFIKSLDFLDRFTNDKGRVRGYFAPLTASGRVMCNGAKDEYSDNIMQIPRHFHDLVGFKSINKKEGNTDDESKYFLVYADYAQLELRSLCCLTGDEALNTLFREGKDLHKYAATKIYNIDESEITPAQRTIAKFSNFSLAYGSGASNFRNILYKMGTSQPPSESECARIVKVWKTAYPRVKEWQERAKNDFFRGVDIKATPNGRPYKAKMYTDLLAIENQGLGSEVSKLALHYLLRDYKHLNFYLLNFIHDAMILEVRGLSEGKKVAKALADSMVKSWHATIANLKINDLPMPTEASVMENWNESEAVYTYVNEGFAPN